MSSGELLSMLNRAITEKQAAHKSYEKYYEQMNNPTLKKIVEGVLQREEQHLEFLNSLKEGLKSNGNIEEMAVLAADGLLRNSKSHEQHADLLKMIMQETGMNLLPAEEADNVVYDEPETEAVLDVEDSFQPVETPLPRSRSAFGYSRTSHNNRSVFSSSFATPKTVFKKY